MKTLGLGSLSPKTNRWQGSIYMDGGITLRNIYPPLDGIHLLKVAQTIVNLQNDLLQYGIDLTFVQACSVYDLALKEQQVCMMKKPR